MSKKDVKKIVLPHSKAKLDLYASYLEKYFAILGLAKGINRINLYDIFCGIGQYEDGNIGSPLIAVKCVEKNNELFEKYNWNKKSIVLNINDGAKNKIENVKALLSGVKIPNCEIKFYNLDADEMLDLVVTEVNSFSHTERNLIFIDPYGYSNTDRTKLAGLLRSRYSEIVLFLPVMQMYRFSEIALTDFERKCYEDLRKFIYEFLPRDEKHETVFEYINAITKGFSFEGNFYSCSHYIERDPGNYYAVFFITSHIYGLERMLEVKWKADPSGGKGFKKKNEQVLDLFGEQLVEYDKQIQFNHLETTFVNALTKSGIMSNVETYELTITSQFLPKHINAVIKELRKKDRIVNCNSSGDITDFGNATYIDYDHYKTNDEKIFFKLR